MKKFIISVLALSLIAGCTPTQEEETVITETFTEESDHYVIEVKYPQFVNLETVNKVIETLVMAEVNSFKETVAEFEEDYDEEYEDLFGDMVSGLYTKYQIYTHNDDLLSIAFDNDIYYEGAAHGMMYREVLNYDLAADKEILLVDMFVGDNDYAAAISETIIPLLNEKLNEDEFAEDEWIADGAGPDPINFQTFNLTEDGFIFHFDPYLVAAYAAGPQQIEIPFETLGAILDPKWINN